MGKFTNRYLTRHTKRSLLPKWKTKSVRFGGILMFLIHCKIYKTMMKAYPILKYNRAHNLNHIWMLLVMFSRNEGTLSLRLFNEYRKRNPRSTRRLLNTLEEMQLIIRKKRCRTSDAIRPGPILIFICKLYNRLIDKCISETEQKYGEINWKWMEKYK